MPADARRRAGLSPAGVVDAALAVIDAAGSGALTLARVAAVAGVASPSLYKHVDGLPALRRLVQLRVHDELAESVRSAVLGRSTHDAVRALARAYRAYLRSYPKRFPFVEAAPDPADTGLSASAERLTEVIFAVLRGYGLTGADLVHGTRCLRAAVHGFTGLEALGGFGRPESVDESFERLLDMITRGVAGPAAA